MTRKDTILLGSLLTINVFMVFMVDLFTFVKRIGISGNGNPGIIALILAWIVFGLFLVVLFIYGIKFFSKENREGNYMYPLAMIVIVLISSTLLAAKFKRLGEIFNGLPTEPESLLYGFGLLNQYTNTLFYNFYVLYIGMAFIILAGWLFVKIRKAVMAITQQSRTMGANSPTT